MAWIFEAAQDRARILNPGMKVAFLNVAERMGSRWAPRGASRV
jgi:hypothetical protein